MCCKEGRVRRILTRPPSVCTCPPPLNNDRSLSYDCIVLCFKKCWCFLMTDQAEFSTHPQNATKTAGDNMTFSCDASGNPVPTFSWNKDGSPVNTSVNPRITFSADKKQLTITNVNKAESGSQYQCLANNSIGQAITSNSASLNVQCKKNFTLYLVSIETKLGCN